jgi:hypothetical protein
MSLEAEHIVDVVERTPGNRRARSERRGKDRRAGGRINRTAPRRSMMMACGAWATGMSFAVFAIVFLATILVSAQTPWIALTASAIAVVTSLFALMLGSLEQRLIEIRLELMMANGGMRQADRRSGERRSGRSDEPVSVPSPEPASPGERGRRSRVRAEAPAG